MTSRAHSAPHSPLLIVVIGLLTTLPRVSHADGHGSFDLELPPSVEIAGFGQDLYDVEVILQNYSRHFPPYEEIGVTTMEIVSERQDILGLEARDEMVQFVNELIASEVVDQHTLFLGNEDSILISQAGIDHLAARMGHLEDVFFEFQQMSARDLHAMPEAPFSIGDARNFNMLFWASSSENARTFLEFDIFEQPIDPIERWQYYWNVRPGFPIQGPGASQCIGAACGFVSPVSYGRLRQGEGIFCHELFCGWLGDRDLEGQQVIPGTPFPDLVSCNDPFCGFPERTALPVLPNGRADIPYVEDEHAGAVLVASFFGDDRGGCSGVALSSTLVATALHCMSDTKNALFDRFSSSPDSVDGWMRLTPEPDQEISVIVYSDVLDDYYDVESFSIAYASEGDVNSFQNSSVVELPSRDIALLHLQGPGITEAEGFFPILNFDYILSGVSDAVSFAGYGITNVELSPNIDIRGRKLISFNFHDGTISRPESDFPLLSWRNDDPFGTGGPCIYDSGGPVYAGFNRGFWDDPRQVIGIVSGMEGSILNSNDCLNPNALGFAEIVSSYRDGICGLSVHQPRGCW